MFKPIHHLQIHNKIADTSLEIEEAQEDVIICWTCPIL